MISINMRLFKIILLLGFVYSFVQGLPVKSSIEKASLSSEITSPSILSSTFLSTLSSRPPTTTSLPKIGDHYDQRQNGSDNYRIHIDGVVFVIAPVEGLLLTGGAPSLDLALPQESQTAIKPENSSSKPNDLEYLDKLKAVPKSAHRSSFRLMNLLAPLLHRLRQQ